MPWDRSDIANTKNSGCREVKTQALSRPLRVRWLDEKGRQIQRVRILRATADRECDALIKTAGALEKVSELLVGGDPEVDMEKFGRHLVETSRIFIDPDKCVVRKVQKWEIVRNPDGSERERLPHKTQLPNVATEIPLKMAGKLIKKSEFINKFVLGLKQQLVHVNSLTYDFLFGIAKELHDADSVIMLGAGPKGNQPLIVHRGGTPYRAFLEGRIQGDKYCLILHLSNMELKAPPPLPVSETPAAAPVTAPVPPVAAAAIPAANPAPAENAKPVEAVQSAPEAKPAEPKKRNPRAKKA